MVSKRGWMGSITALALASCLASPPRTVNAASGWRVKSERGEEARELCTRFERLEPRIGALVPDWQLPTQGEVWIQEEPKLYAFPAAAKSDAEGLWAEDERCILLARGADDLERTLAHEMVHAGLGPSWRMLPGSFEEGLCDWVAARVCPDGAARLRAGRLSSAALALGGLELELELEPRDGERSSSILRHLAARVVLVAEDSPFADDAHLEVFRLQVGLSSTHIEVSRKRNYYGLAFLLVERIVDRIGIDGLNALCREAKERELSCVPSAWLLEAADLSDRADDWRAAALQALGAAELTEIVRMYPEFVTGAITRAAGLVSGADSPEDGLAQIRAEIGLRGSGACIDAARLDFVAAAVRQSCDTPPEDQLASASNLQ